MLCLNNFKQNLSFTSLQPKKYLYFTNFLFSKEKKLVQMINFIHIFLICFRWLHTATGERVTLHLFSFSMRAHLHPKEQAENVDIIFFNQTTFHATFNPKAMNVVSFSCCLNLWLTIIISLTTLHV